VCKYYEIKGKTKIKYHNVVTIPNFNRTIAEIEAKSTHLIENMHDHKPKTTAPHNRTILFPYLLKHLLCYVLYTHSAFS
jgi:hypothetical protein